jgi:Restriction endonuclease
MAKKRWKLMERQVERVERLIAQEGSEVTWNDRIPDPDNPHQLRQIDITIRRDGRLTIVECRMEKSPQDVTWIEQLMGRRESLRAESVIAVSASKFTKGAIRKAEAKGIILRNLATLSAPEIRDWGKACEASLVYYEFRNTRLELTLPRGTQLGTPSYLKRDGTPIVWRGLFELIMREVDSEMQGTESWVHVDFPLGIDILVSGVAPTECTIDTDLRRTSRKVSLASVLAYSAVGSPTADTYARVQHFNEAYEVIDASDEVAVVVDMSHVPTPPDCLFLGGSWDFGRVVTVKWVKAIGLAEAMNAGAAIAVSFRAH